MPSTPPGTELYSREWFEAYGTNVPEPLYGAVKDICEGYYLGNTSDPNIFADMILNNIKENINKKLVTRDGRNYVIFGVSFENNGIFYLCETRRKKIRTQDVARICNVTE